MKQLKLILLIIGMAILSILGTFQTFLYNWYLAGMIRPNDWYDNKEKRETLRVSDATRCYTFNTVTSEYDNDTLTIVISVTDSVRNETLATIKMEKSFRNYCRLLFNPETEEALIDAANDDVVISTAGKVKMMTSFEEAGVEYDSLIKFRPRVGSWYKAQISAPNDNWHLEGTYSWRTIPGSRPCHHRQSKPKEDVHIDYEFEYY